jgi:hypothetical protein
LSFLTSDALSGRYDLANYVQTLTHKLKSPLSAIRGAVVPAQFCRCPPSHGNPESSRVES